jgi:hypothetical protein
MLSSEVGPQAARLCALFTRRYDWRTEGVRLLGFPAPDLLAGFPATHSLMPLPWWITEISVPPDNHLSSPHVHVDHMWVAIVPEARSAGQPGHPFAWYTAAEVEAGLPMFEDSRALAPLLFSGIAGLPEETVTGDGMLARLAAAGAS